MRTGGTRAVGRALFARRWEHRASEVAEKRLFCALRFSSEGFALALRSRGTALTKSSPGCALACGTVENAFEAPIRRRPLRDCDHSWQRPSAGTCIIHHVYFKTSNVIVHGRFELDFRELHGQHSVEREESSWGVAPPGLAFFFCLPSASAQG